MPDWESLPMPDELCGVSTGEIAVLRRPEDLTPASVVVKVAASDPTSRATGVGMSIYERSEVRFHRELAPRVGGPLEWNRNRPLGRGPS
jgi:hypothetical protein